MRCGAYRALLELKTLWPQNPRGGMRSAPPKTLGGDRTFVLEILPTLFLSALHIGRGE